MPPLLLYRLYHSAGMTNDGMAVTGLNLTLPLLDQEEHRDHVRGAEAQFRTFLTTEFMLR